MKQALFVQKNQKKWEEFEKQLKHRKSLAADDLSYIYVHLTEDLAFAKARYQNSQVYQYLNQLTLKAHNLLYRNKPQERSKFLRFWTNDVPKELNRAYPYIGYAFLIMMTGVSIGWLSAANDETFIRLILGDSYVDMTLENIKKGNPMAVYESMGEASMFFRITANNIRVSFLAFAAGLLFSFGTGYILLSNGIMLGAFHYLFFREGVFSENIITIWVHGTLEISAIVIAGAAGLVMGNSILFPGTYPRAYSFRKGAKRGVKIVISLVPFFIIAGFIESFITRHTEWPLSVKVLLISISAAVVIFYLFVLPHRSTNNGRLEN